MNHPYVGIPDHARWDRGVAMVQPGAVDPVVRFPVRIAREQPIVTAGSCFAQHIARYLRNEGFNYLVTEPGHAVLEDTALRKAFNYGVYSARYGNIYTSRQLEQLFRRAYGQFLPQDSVWTGTDGRFVDPFRPTIQPKGFPTQEELLADRAQHLAAVRRAFEELEVFVFTLGLTECWAAAADGAVFPIAPGVAGGVFDPERYRFLNLGVDDVVADMTRFVGHLRSVNPRAAVVLTVSPVPLNATAVDRHVLISTSYSKSVLRVACEMLVNSMTDLHYFPSYEIVTGAFSRGAYFDDDLRSIRESGVEHVMSLFFKHATVGGSAPSTSADVTATEIAKSNVEDLDRALEVLCDEELLTQSPNGEVPSGA